MGARAASASRFFAFLFMVIGRQHRTKPSISVLCPSNMSSGIFSQPFFLICVKCFTSWPKTFSAHHCKARSWFCAHPLTSSLTASRLSLERSRQFSASQLLPAVRSQDLFFSSDSFLPQRFSFSFSVAFDMSAASVSACSGFGFFGPLRTPFGQPISRSLVSLQQNLQRWIHQPSRQMQSGQLPQDHIGN